MCFIYIGSDYVHTWLLDSVTCLQDFHASVSDMTVRVACASKSMALKPSDNEVCRGYLFVLQ